MWPERVYASLPVPLQHLATSLQGWQFHRQRYRSSSFHETARALKRNEELAPEALADLQFSMFREFVAHCYSRSPYYRALWKSRGLHPGDIRRGEDVRLIPITPRQDLRRKTKEFLTSPVSRRMTSVHTSGTTGSPLTVYFSAEDIGRRYAFLDRCRRWAGVRIGQKRASFTGRNIVPERQTGPPFWRYNRSGNQLLLSSYHLSPRNLAAYVDALRRFQPEIIDGYPSAIHVVADHILHSDRHLDLQVRAVMVSAETVLPNQRQTIEAAFQAKLFNQYASSEGAPFVSECARGRLHVHTDSGLIEILDTDGNPVLPGQVGQMVITSFTTHVVPLLRFAMGDAAIPGEGHVACPCGLPFPVVDAIVGRVDDFLFTTDRGFVGRMDTVFKGLPSSIVEAQIVQTAADTVVLRIVPDRKYYKTKHADMVLAEMRKKLGQRVTLRLEEVESLPRSSNGKLRAVVNLCGDLIPSGWKAASQNGSTLAVPHSTDCSVPKD